MITKPSGFIKELNLGFRQEGEVAPVVLQGVGEAFLVFGAVKAGKSGLSKAAGTAVIVFEHCLHARFGHPNGGSLGKHALARACGAYEVDPQSLFEASREPDTQPVAGLAEGQELRQFVFVFSERVFECLASSFTAKLDVRPFREIVEDLVRRLADRNR